MNEADITKTEPMVLANIGGGQLEEEFQHHLAEVLEILGEPDRYQLGTGNVLSATIKIEIDISLIVDGGIKTVAHQTELKRPKTKEKQEQLFLKDGVFLVQPEIHQPNLFAMPKPGDKKGA